MLKGPAVRQHLFQPIVLGLHAEEEFADISPRLESNVSKLTAIKERHWLARVDVTSRSSYRISHYVRGRALLCIEITVSIGKAVNASY